MKKFILLIALLLVGCQTYYAPDGNAFPRGWGKPPEIQTKDYRKLPSNYGYGSSTLYNWINKNLYDTTFNIPDGPSNIFFLD